MPSRLPKGRYPERFYFWNILNTLQEKYVKELVQHAIEQRNTIAGNQMEVQAIEVSEAWLDRLQALPFISRKIFPLTSYSL